MSYNVLELFGGCGGLGYGFHKHNFNIICCNELEEQIGETYKHNFPDTKVIIGDITKQDIKFDICNTFSNKECDVIVGGPPCVAYSMSGFRNSRDPRGQLFEDYLQMVNKLKPKIFVMENVKGILTIKHDKEELNEEEKTLADKYYSLETQKLKLEAEKKKTKKTEIDLLESLKEELKKVKSQIKKMEKDTSKFRINVHDKIINKFKNIGYEVEFKLHNSADFGVPQKRERVIFIGKRKDLNFQIEFPIPTHSKNQSELSNWVTVEEAIGDLKELEENKEFSQIYTSHSDLFLEKIKNTKIGESVNKKYKEAFFRCFPNKPSGTVKENHGGVFVHYEKNRVMTPRELARLQSFPDTFKFKGSKSSILKQLGNAVPCGLAEAIAFSVLNSLNSI
jgi:site-specific DNA-cytosine methylase